VNGDEFGGQLLMSMITEVFRDTTGYLWLYTLLAFAFANGQGLRSPSNQLLGFLVIGRNVSKNFRWRQFHVWAAINTMCAIGALIAVCSLILLNGFFVSVFGILLELIGLVDVVTGIPKVAIITGFLVFVGMVGSADRHTKLESQTQSSLTE